MRMPVLVFTLSAVTVAALALFAAADLSTGPAQAGGGGPADAISIDMDISGNEANALGERQDCIQANPGDTVTFDVTVSGVPPYQDNAPIGFVDTEDTGGIIAFEFALNFDSEFLEVTTADTGLLLNVNDGSSIFNSSDALPDGDSPWTGSGLDAGTGIPEEGDGVLVRVTADVDAGTPVGGYPLTLTGLAVGDPGTFFIPDAVNNATLAVGLACSEVPTPSPTPSPTPAFAFAKGDTQCDNDVDSVDALMTLRKVVGFSTSQEAGCPEIGEEFASIFGDMDCDDDLDSVDALFVLRHLVGLTVVLPGGCAPIGA